MPDTLSALFVDFDNIYYTLATQIGMAKQDACSGVIDVIDATLAHVATALHLKPVIRMAFADWSLVPDVMVMSELYTMGIECSHIKATERKNSADIELSLSIQETIYTRPDISHALVLAGDRDYMPVASRVIKAGKQIHFFGFTGTMSGDLKKLVGDDHCCFLERDRGIWRVRDSACTGKAVAKTSRGRQLSPLKMAPRRSEPAPSTAPRGEKSSPRHDEPTPSTEQSPPETPTPPGDEGTPTTAPPLDVAAPADAPHDASCEREDQPASSAAMLQHAETTSDTDGGRAESSPPEPDDDLLGPKKIEVPLPNLSEAQGKALNAAVEFWKAQRSKGFEGAKVAKFLVTDLQEALPSLSHADRRGTFNDLKELGVITVYPYTTFFGEQIALFEIERHFRKRLGIRD